MKTLRVFLVWLCFLFVFISGVAQNYKFRRMETSDGLPNNQVNSILKDSKGFLWFGTASGLARYDGYRFKVFRSKTNNAASLPDNFVYGLVEDGYGNLWMKSGNTYTIFDESSETFHNNLRPYLESKGVSGLPQYVFVDHRKNLWVFVLGKGLFCNGYQESSSKFLPVGRNRLPNGNVTFITECREGILLAYDDGAVICVNPNRLSVKWSLTNLVSVTKSYGTPEVFSLYVDCDQDLWIYSTLGTWVYRLSDKSWQNQWNDRMKSGSHNMVRTVVQDKMGNMWIGKDQDGIDIWNKRTGKKIYSLHYNPDDGRSLPNNTIMTLYEDKDGIMWVGTYKKGVACYGEGVYKFDISSQGDINCIEEGPKGRLCLGTNDHGIVFMNLSHGTAGRSQNVLSKSATVCLLYSKDGKLWIGSFGGGLDCLDGGRTVHYHHQSGNMNSLASDNVWSLAEDYRGNIWIGTLGGGLQCLNPKTGHFVTYNTHNSRLLSDYVASICASRDCRRMIVGTASGLSVLNYQSGRLVNYMSRKRDYRNLSNLSINQVFEDSRGLVWVGTRAGLYLYNLQKGYLQTVSPLGVEPTEQFIAGITEDRNHQMWVTTTNGLMNIIPCLNAPSQLYRFSFHLYNDKDGLQNSEFNQRSIKLLSTGEIAVGGLNGVNIFNPKSIQYNRKRPRVLFTDFRLFNEEVAVGQKYNGLVVLKKELNSVGKVELKYSQNVFTVVFASDNYILPEKTSYLYMLEGFDKTWMLSPPDMHQVTYTNLSPGKYVLRVKAINSDGLEGINESSLTIMIHPPFWMTGWAYLFYLLLVAVAVYMALNAVRRKERNRFLIRQMEQDARKNEELNQMKFRFFTNVSHELRTPLTLIISPLETMMKETSDSVLLHKIELIYRNAQRLLNLINQLLDFRKSEVTDLHLTLSEGDIVDYVHGVCNSFLALSEKKNIHLTFFSAQESLNMSFDKDKIGKIIMNLLSNAFKFTPEGGRVDVSIQVAEGNADMVRIKVSDTGIGIKDEDKKHIFDRFYQVEDGNAGNSTVGSGIGLSLVYEYAKLHGGSVQVLDNVESGSVFIVDIPLRRAEGKAPSQDVAEVEEVPVENLQTTDRPLETDEEQIVSASTKPLAMIVEDNKDMVDFLADSLRLYFRTASAYNGREAWEQIPTLMPDIVISDVMMPEMDGNELCRRVKGDSRTSGIPFVLLTARQTIDDMVEGLTTGADDYVTKPFNMEVLILRLRKLVAMYAIRTQNHRIDPEPEKIVITSLDEQLVGEAIKYVENHLDHPELSVESMSSELGMSRVQLYKKLLHITGKTPTDFIRIIRLKRAAQYLKESQLNVSEIAYRVGINNPKMFAKYFKEEFGMLPSDFQNKEGR
jgi:signal transduction histidine kinase/ligand-binding sensor domain-containing protein/DNA-binding response OmpR family regulator